MVYREVIQRWIFQPSLPARGATVLSDVPNGNIAISTLAPREGSDAPAAYSNSVAINFNPRSPRGERLK